MTDQLKQDILKNIHYNDSLSDLASVMEEVGTRRFLMDFKHNSPRHFDEIVAQIGRLESRKLPSLLVKQHTAVNAEGG